MQPTNYLDLLHNHIDITRVPFSDRGSRLLILKDPTRPRLMLKLAERLTWLESDIEAYLRRPPFLKNFRLIDELGDPLDFTVETAPDMLQFNTRLGPFRLVFQDRRTISLGLPPGRPVGICVQVMPVYQKTGGQGGTLKAVRNLSYASNATVLKNTINICDGGFEVEFIVQPELDSAIVFKIHPETDLQLEPLPFSKAQAAAHQRWLSWFSRVPQVAVRYQATYAYAWWIMANNLISPQGKVLYESMAPSKINYVGLWLWDSALHSLAYRHVDPDLARNQIRAMLAHQLPTGMVPDAVFDEAIVSTLDHPIIGEVTKPPILAWAALKLHETDPDIEFLREIYVPLVRLNSWWFTMNDDNGDGLAQYNHPYSSGLDDSPLWDYGMPVESPDLNTYLCIEMGSLALMAEILGMENEGAMWRRRSAAIVHRMIQSFWDEKTGLFWAKHDEQTVPVVTPFNLYPLWTGQLPVAIRDRLIAHLVNPNEFGGEYMIPTVSRNDPHYNPEQMWRGPVWANINYFFIEALRQVGRNDMADELQRKTLDLVMSHKNIYEYYNAETGRAPNAAADIFGWTAAVFIDLAIDATRRDAAASPDGSI